MAVDIPGAPDLAPLITMPHASIAVVSLGFPTEHVARALDGSRLLIPRIERRSVLSMVFPAVAFPSSVPSGHVLVTAFVGGALRSELFDRSDAEVSQLVEAEVADLLGTTGAPTLRHITRWPGALPQAIAGHGDRLAVAEAIEARRTRGSH